MQPHNSWLSSVSFTSMTPACARAFFKRSKDLSSIARVAFTSMAPVTFASQVDETTGVKRTVARRPRRTSLFSAVLSKFKYFSRRSFSRRDFSRRYFSSPNVFAVQEMTMPRHSGVSENSFFLNRLALFVLAYAHKLLAATVYYL